MENKYLTLVFKNPSTELVNELTDKQECVYMSWNHVPNERDRFAELANRHKLRLKDNELTK